MALRPLARLDAADLRAMGITRVGHQQRLLHPPPTDSAVAAGPGMAAPPGRLKVMWAATVVGTDTSRLSRSELLALNEQISFIAALVWCESQTPGLTKRLCSS